MQFDLNTGPTPILNRMMKPNPPITFLHILHLIKALTEPDDYVARLSESELLYIITHDPSISDPQPQKE
ncbi:hypothetical protein TMatcc_005185 [Talaromyces marneffei ATCC 18224]